jgi:hypothetical protein
VLFGQLLKISLDRITWLVCFELEVYIDMLLYSLTAIGLIPGGREYSTHLHKTIHRTTQLIWEEFVPCPVFASYTLLFALN